MYRAFRYRLSPNSSQLSQLSQWEGSTRWLWNHFLSVTTAQYATDKTFVWGFDLKKQIPALKQTHEWLKQVPAHALQNVAFDIDRALTRATKTRDLGFPKYKTKRKANGSIKIDQVGSHIKISNTHITIPKLGQVKWRYHRPITGKLKSISITRDLDHWYVSVLCEVPDVLTIVDVDQTKTVGIDLGVSSFAILSDGTKIESPKFLANKLKKLKRYQRRQKNKQKSSNNSKKQYDKTARVHRKIRNQRVDWLHKVSAELTDKFEVICIENLKIKELLQKKQLSRAIADQGWGIFVTQLIYKAAAKSKHVTKIGTYMPSTKTCSCCGSVRAMKLSDRVYICENPQCADYLKTKDRDLNAASNIHVWGLAATPNIRLYTPGTGGIKACGDTSTQDCQAIDWHLEVSAKQEAASSLGLW